MAMQWDRSWRQSIAQNSHTGDTRDTRIDMLISWRKSESNDNSKNEAVRSLRNWKEEENRCCKFADRRSLEAWQGCWHGRRMWWEGTDPRRRIGHCISRHSSGRRWVRWTQERQLCSIVCSSCGNGFRLPILHSDCLTCMRTQWRHIPL